MTMLMVAQQGPMMSHGDSIATWALFLSFFALAAAILLFSDRSSRRYH